MADNLIAHAVYPLWPTERAEGVKAPLFLWLKQNLTNQFTNQWFRFDSGADITIMPVGKAQKLGLEIPAAAENETIQTGGGKVIRKVWKGHLDLKLPSLTKQVFRWPCWFHEDPEHPFVIGTAGVINGDPFRFRFTMDGTPIEPSFPFGTLFVEVLTDSESS